MSLQEIFNTAATHLLNQGLRCVDDVGTCCLWDDNGNACALGALLERPTGAFAENRTGLLEQSPSQWPSMVALRYDVDVTPELRELLDELQIIHDKHEPEDWADALGLLAWSMGLEDMVVAQWEAGNA